MANYYCLMAGLPDIKLDDTALDVSIEDLREELDINATDADKKILFYFFLKNDCANVAKLLKNPEAEINPHGNYTMEQYVDLMTSAREMNFNVHRYPAFLSIFAREYQYKTGKEGYFGEDDVMRAFYEYAIETCPNKMVRQWFKLNYDITNVLTAMLARKYGWNVADYIQGENEITEMILNNNTKDFDLSTEYDYVADLMKIVDCEDPVEKEKRIDAMKWVWLDEQTFFEPFSIEAVFAYLCKLEMLDRWERLDVEKGQETFRQIIEDLRGEAKVPEEFVTTSATAPKATTSNKSEGNYNKSEK